MRSAHQWNVWLELPDGSIESYLAKDRETAERTATAFLKLNPQVRAHLFRLKFTNGRLFPERKPLNAPRPSSVVARFGDADGTEGRPNGQTSHSGAAVEEDLAV